MRITANYYQQFDADHTREVPAEGYGGWQRAEVDLDPAHTALVVMHAWDCGTREQFPGWYRAVEYIPRSQTILAEVFPPLLGAVRQVGLTLFHVVGGGSYYQQFPGYERAVKLAGPPPAPPERVASDVSLEHLQALRAEHVFVGPHNAEDCSRGFAQMKRFPPQVEPQGQEGIAENGHQLFALCREQGINHLIYTGFAINWCLFMSPGGMMDMAPRGLMCSAVRQATTAVENKESARHEWAKELGLWRVALAWGFIFDADDLVAALSNQQSTSIHR